jgi:hypothetical protein
MMTLARDTDSGEWKYVQSPQVAPRPEGNGKGMRGGSDQAISTQTAPKKVEGL